MGGVLAGELCSTRRRCLPYWRSFRRKIHRHLSRRSSRPPMKLVRYDVRNFTVAELCLLMKKHDENGACRATIYQYEGYVHVLEPEELFQKSSRVTSRTGSLHENDGSGRFRILFVSEFEDPFYLRTMALQLEHLEAENQTTETEKALLPEQPTQPVDDEVVTGIARQVRDQVYDDDEVWYSATAIPSTTTKQLAARRSPSLTAKGKSSQTGKSTLPRRGSSTKAAIFAATLLDIPSPARSPQPERVRSRTAIETQGGSTVAPHSVYL